MTFGFPNGLLRENDIEPEMLFEFPEDLRAEILSTLQVQLEEWHRNQAAQQNQAQPAAQAQEDAPIASAQSQEGQAEAVAAQNEEA
jgi:hypothetical protein